MLDVKQYYGIPLNPIPLLLQRLFRISEQALFNSESRIQDPNPGTKIDVRIRYSDGCKCSVASDRNYTFQLKANIKAPLIIITQHLEREKKTE